MAMLVGNVLRHMEEEEHLAEHEAAMRRLREEKSMYAGLLEQVRCRITVGVRRRRMWA